MEKRFSKTSAFLHREQVFCWLAPFVWNHTLSAVFKCDLRLEINGSWNQNSPSLDLSRKSFYMCADKYTASLPLLWRREASDAFSGILTLHSSVIFTSDSASLSVHTYDTPWCCTLDSLHLLLDVDEIKIQGVHRCFFFLWTRGFKKITTCTWLLLFTNFELFQVAVRLLLSSL